MSAGERDVLDRLDALGLAWYVTGSWALAADAEPRMTSDIHVVVDMDIMRRHARLSREAHPLVWAQVDRAAPMSELDTARFVVRRLDPDLDGPRLDAIMARREAEWHAGMWSGFARWSD